jgi:hypothetical protein
MKTAVDELWDMIPKDIQSMIEKQFDGHNQAKEIEKEQHKRTYSKGYMDCDDYYDFEIFFNETYGGNK